MILPTNKQRIRDKTLVTTRFGAWTLLDPKDAGKLAKPPGKLKERLKKEGLLADDSNMKRIAKDFVNLNNPWARKQLWPEGLIRDLPRERFEPLYEQMFE